MVVIGSLATDPTVVMQERTARAPTSTVHAPQRPIPHPYLAPLSFNMSRSTHKSGISGETSTVAATLLTVNLIGIDPPHPVRTRRLAPKQALGRECTKSRYSKTTGKRCRGLLSGVKAIADRPACRLPRRNPQVNVRLRTHRGTNRPEKNA